jgi:hypothetical protein
MDFIVFCFSVGNMLQSKRAGNDDLTESSHKNRRIDNGGGETLDLIMPGLRTIHFSVHISLQLYWSTHNYVPSCLCN